MTLVERTIHIAKLSGLSIVLGVVISAVWMLIPHMIICVCEPNVSYLGSPLPMLIVDGMHPSVANVLQQVSEGRVRIRGDGVILDLAFWTIGVWCLLNLLSVRSDHKRKLRRLGGLCIKCGYSLRGNVTGVCPECGTSV